MRRFARATERVRFKIIVQMIVVYKYKKIQIFLKLIVPRQNLQFGS